MNTSKPRGIAQRGQALIESALSLLVVTSVVFGTIEFSRLVYAYNFVAYAARDAVRFASVRGAESGEAATGESVANFVTGQAIGLIASDLAVTASWSPDKNPGSIVKVRVAYRLPGVVGGLLAASSTVSSEAQMAISR